MDSSRETERTLEASRLIRGYLPELLPDEATVVDEILAHILKAAASNPGAAAEAARSVLTVRPATLAWMTTVLRDEQLRPPESQEWEERGVDPIGGRTPVAAIKVVCPRGDFMRYLHSVGQHPGRCPTHGLELTTP